MFEEDLDKLREMKERIDRIEEHARHLGEVLAVVDQIGIGNRWQLPSRNSRFVCNSLGFVLLILGLHDCACRECHNEVESVDSPSHYFSSNMTITRRAIPTAREYHEGVGDSGRPTNDIRTVSALSAALLGYK